MSTTPTPRRVRRPMVEMSGTVSDLREGDFVDILGGSGYQRSRIESLVHHIEHREARFSDFTYQVASGPLQYSKSYAKRMATTPRHATVTFVNGVVVHLIAEVPVTFRRFAD